MEFGYAGKAAVINLDDQSIEHLQIEDSFKQKFIGGRGFIAKWLLDLVPIKTDALSPENVLIFATGALTGTLAATSARMSVGAKAPETGIWSIGNVGGFMGAYLKKAGWDALIIKGRAETPTWLSVDDGEIKFHNASRLWGMDTYALDRAIKKNDPSKRMSIACIGTAGENLSHLATIMVDRVRSAGRGGLGAVMGSKNLKAIAVNGSQSVPIYDPTKFMAACAGYQKRSIQLYFRKRWESGSYGAVTRYNTAGALSTRNAQDTAFEGIDGISAETYNSRFKIERMKACFACTIPCWTTFYIGSGDYKDFVGQNMNATTFKEFGARCGLSDMDQLLHACALSNRLGIDTISAPATIAFAMECYQRGILTEKDTDGLKLEWGNGPAINVLIRKMAYREGIGDVLSLGVVESAKRFGPGSEKFALHVKRMETVATDPRGQPSWGLGYATSSRGACHMRAYSNFEYKGMTDAEMMRIAGTTEIQERFAHKGKGKAVAYLENLRCVGDAMGLCHFLTRAELGFQEAYLPMYQSATGIEITPEELYAAGERIYNIERVASLREGLTPADDTLPARYLEEPATGGDAKGKTCPLEPMLKEYYQARNWDPVSGYPSHEKAVELEITDLIPN